MIECSAFYTYDADRNEYELRCPSCRCPFLNFLGDVPDELGPDDDGKYLGEEAVCYECKHQFVVTENCWERNEETL